MSIEFGKVQRYCSDRGFGFVSSTFTNYHKDIFFHITKIKKKYPELAQQLDKQQNLDSISFWYDIETTNRGQQVGELWLNFQDIPQSYQSEVNELETIIQTAWQDLEKSKPSWLDHINTEIFGSELTQKLNVARDFNIKKIEEERQKQKAVAEKEEIFRISKKYSIPIKHARELRSLLIHMRPLGFRFSGNLSNYIRRTKLGYKYPNISGIVRMADDDSEWDFDGGFPPDIYAIICQELGLQNQKTNSRAIGFTSYNDLN